MSAEVAVRAILERIDNAWHHKQFSGLESCFHEDAVIVGPGYVEFGRGRQKCAESYKEFASNAQILDYKESNHSLRIWHNTAVYTFHWEMTYQREAGPKHDTGTDQMVLEQTPEGWQVVWRYIYFQPA
jgi:ketosteroid isomerase-like protein